MTPRLFHFVGSHTGPWSVDRHIHIVGDTLPEASALHVTAIDAPTDNAPLAASGVAPAWVLRGMTSNARYATHAEQSNLRATQAMLGRESASLAALIPIRKSPIWWKLSQDQRREVFEERSRHIAASMKYLPAIARRLHHCRDLGPSEPFDFLTWFEYAPEHAGLFDELVAMLRATEEWKFVEREVDIRLRRAD